MRHDDDDDGGGAPKAAAAAAADSLRVARTTSSDLSIPASLSPISSPPPNFFPLPLLCLSVCVYVCLPLHCTSGVRARKLSTQERCPAEKQLTKSDITRLTGRGSCLPSGITAETRSFSSSSSDFNDTDCAMRFRDCNANSCLFPIHRCNPSSCVKKEEQNSLSEEGKSLSHSQIVQQTHNQSIIQRNVR